MTVRDNDFCRNHLAQIRYYDRVDGLAKLGVRNSDDRDLRHTVNLGDDAFDFDAVDAAVLSIDDMIPSAH